MKKEYLVSVGWSYFEVKINEFDYKFGQMNTSGIYEYV